MSRLQLACFFATWCSAGSFHSATRWWLDSLMMLADRSPLAPRTPPREWC